MEGRLLRWAIWQRALGGEEDGWIEEGRVWTWRAGDVRKDGLVGREEDGRGWEVSERDGESDACSERVCLKGRE